MSINNRPTRVSILYIFIKELAQMDKEFAQLVSDWTLSAAILYLVFIGVANSAVGLSAVTIITSIDIMRLWQIYLKMKTSGELDEKLQQ